MTPMKRIIIHWTAGAHKANAVDMKHYHVLIEHDGRIISGLNKISDNIPPLRTGQYAAHTRNLNSYSIGIAMCGMHGAKEAPFDPGPYPLTKKQVEVCCAEVARLAKQHDIPVTNKTVLTHAEVEPNLGVKQRGKWDITRLVFEPNITGPKAVGDYFRQLVMHYMDQDDSDQDDMYVLQSEFDTLLVEVDSIKNRLSVLEESASDNVKEAMVVNSTKMPYWKNAYEEITTTPKKGTNMQPKIQGLIRHAITIAAGYLVSQGVVDESTMQQIIGGIMALVGVILSVMAPEKK